MHRIRFTAPVVAVAALLALTACSTPSSAPAAQAEPEPAAAAPKAVEIDATVAASPGPVEPETSAASTAESDDVWEITPDGIGPVKLGDSLDALAAQYGGELHDPYSPQDSTCLSVDIRTGDRSTTVVASGTGGIVQTIHLFADGDNHDMRPDPAAELDTASAEGFGIGTGSAALQAAWGEATAPAWGPGGSVAWLREGEGGHVANFITTASSFYETAGESWVSVVMVYDAGADAWPACFD